MWNILIVIIIAIVIFMLNPLKFEGIKPSGGVDKKTKTEVNAVVNETQKQVEYARQLQQQEQENLEN